MVTDNIAAQVAVAVMGWTEREINIEHGVERGVYFDQHGNLQREVVFWHPDTDIADAWSVVERMRELGYNFSVLGMSSYEAYFDLPGSVGINIRRGDTAPLAICRAALAALAEGAGE
jgi:hypothetical protein